MTRPYATHRGGAPVAVPSMSVGSLEILPAARILDVRDEATFALGHLPGAGRLSPPEFVARRAELPSREQPVIVVHDEPARAREAAETLAGLGFTHVGWLDLPLAEERWGHVSREPALRLWSPSAFVEREFVRARTGRALDVACGSGRAAVFLALAGFSVEGWDVDDTALERGSALATRHGVGVRFERVDLERGTLPDREAAFHLIVVVRFLHRPLFPWLERALAPGGVLLYETFADGQQRFGPPRRERHLLRPRELLTAFPSLVVENHEHWHEHWPPPVLEKVAARRPRL